MPSIVGNDAVRSSLLFLKHGIFPICARCENTNTSIQLKPKTSVRGKLIISGLDYIRACSTSASLSFRPLSGINAHSQSWFAIVSRRLGMCRRMLQAMIGSPTSTSTWPVTVQGQTRMFPSFTAILGFFLLLGPMPD